MKRFPVILIIILALASCSKVPGGVIEPEEMAQLMADVHTGEAMLEMNRQDYPNDSMKLVLRQSIYVRSRFSRTGSPNRETESLPTPPCR